MKHIKISDRRADLIALVTIVAIVALAVIGMSFKPAGQDNRQANDAILTTFNDASLTIEAVNAAIISEGIKHPQIVLKQVILETGWLKSYGCRYRKNLFGFRTDKGYMKFDTWQESVKYYKRWQDRLYTDGDYYSFLECMYKIRNRCVRYAEDANYIRSLKGIKIDM